MLDAPRRMYASSDRTPRGEKEKEALLPGRIMSSTAPLRVTFTELHPFGHFRFRVVGAAVGAAQITGTSLYGSSCRCGSTSSMLNHMCTTHSSTVQQAAAREVNPDNPPELTRKRQFDNALVDMLVRLRWTLSEVKGVGFREMMNGLDQTHVIPSREELKALRDARHEKPKQKHITWESSSSDSD